METFSSVEALQEQIIRVLEEKCEVQRQLIIMLENKLKNK